MWGSYTSFSFIRKDSQVISIIYLPNAGTTNEKLQELPADIFPLLGLQHRGGASVEDGKADRDRLHHMQGFH